MKWHRLSACALALCCAFAQAPRTVWDGVYSEAQAKRGQALYAQHCSGCHGTDLQGGESAPALTGIDFMANWNGLNAGELFERIRVSMPLSRPGSLSREQNADILAYMFQVNRFPAGTSDLARQTEILNQIRLEQYPPQEGK